MSKYKIGITQGDPNGIGMEVIIKCFQEGFLFKKCTPILYADRKIFSFWKKHLELDNPRYNIITKPEDAIENELNLINVDSNYLVEIGEPKEEAGNSAFMALSQCMHDAKNGKLDAIVTAPLDKSTVNPEGMVFTGHTDYLASEFEVEDYMMLMTCDEVTVGLVTTHIPLGEVAKVITKEKILEKLEILQASLINDFGITKPRIAVLGLNPHAGDSGVIGNEEIDIIVPAINEAREKGIVVIGAYPSDGFFGSREFQNFDGVLAMYHDQGLIPFKYISEDRGVNYTAGLTVVRTSPDHGTAYDIAGKGIAQEGSMRTSILKAVDILRKREEANDLSKNPLLFSEQKRERFRGDF